MRFFLLSFLVVPFAAFAGPLDGAWSGDGRVDHEELNSSVPARFYLEIHTTADHIKIEECWQVEGRPAPQCITSDEDIRDEWEIWKKDKRIGELDPERLMTLEANAHVAEQMVFDLGNDGRLRYQYTYVNEDGATRHRKVILKREGTEKAAR